MNFISLFTKNQLLKYYVNLGSNSCNLNRNNSYYILGLNFNISFLNLNKTVFNFRKKINFLVSFFKNKNNFSFLLINSNKNKVLIKKYIKHCSKIKCSYFNGTWWNGLLKSFKMYISYKSLKKNKKFKFFHKKYPNAVLYINRQRYGDFNLNSLFINKEINDVSMQNIMFISDYIDISKNPTAMLVNTRTYLNNLYLFNLCVKIVKKCVFLSKKKFFSYLYNLYFIIYVKNVNLFYELNYCVKYKKSIMQNNLWNDDLR